jgi:hypothetical protein
MVRYDGRSVDFTYWMAHVEDFEDFVRALEDKSIKINDKNLPGLSRLSAEFGFHALSAKISDFSNSPDLTTTTAVPLVSVSLLQEGLPCGEFTFIVNDKPFRTSIAEAVLLSPAVCDQLQVDACARRFVIWDPEIVSTDFCSVQRLFSGDADTVLQKSHQKSLIRLSQQLCNVYLERFFFTMWNRCTFDCAMTLSSVFATCSLVSLRSVSDLLLLSVDALDDLLSSESFLVDSEDALLRLLAPLRHSLLLRHIRWEFVSAAAIASLCEESTESLWLAVVDRLMNPSGLDSMIVSQFPPLLDEFRKKCSNLLWRGSRDGFTAEEFHRRCDGRANTLTLIEDTDGNVFGGFTPVKWESRTCRIDRIEIPQPHR